MPGHAEAFVPMTAPWSLQASPSRTMAPAFAADGGMPSGWRGARSFLALCTPQLHLDADGHATVLRRYAIEPNSDIDGIVDQVRGLDQAVVIGNLAATSSFSCPDCCC